MDRKKQKGKIKWFDEQKGYGFIESDTVKKDFFVHRSSVESIEGSLEKGQKVEFEIGEGRKGPQAISVRMIEG